jgi:membrane-bound inhibitor of C-type lysozyme
MKTSTAVIGVLILLAVLGAGWWYYSGTKPAATTPPANGQALASVAFACDAGQSINATFYEGSVALALSDGRSMTLPQAVSGSGIRYTNADESFVFWGKGNTAFVEEGASQEQTYSGCIVVAPDTSGVLSQVYATSTAGFSFRFPQGYTVDSNYVYQAMGPGKDIPGVKFTIPSASTAGTNLSKDSYISVEWLPTTTTCSASRFLDQGSPSTTFSDAGVDYSVATTSGAGAGNIYDEAVFAIPGTSPCTAIRYYIHSTQVGNYPAGTVTAFDKAAVTNEFDLIRRSLVLGR